MNGFKYMSPFRDLRKENYDRHNHSLTGRYINFIAFLLVACSEDQTAKNNLYSRDNS